MRNRFLEWERFLDDKPIHKAILVDTFTKIKNGLSDDTVKGLVEMDCLKFMYIGFLLNTKLKEIEESNEIPFSMFQVTQGQTTDEVLEIMKSLLKKQNGCEEQFLGFAEYDFSEEVKRRSQIIDQIRMDEIFARGL